VGVRVPPFARFLLFSEIKKGIHMALVTATESRTGARSNTFGAFACASQRPNKISTAQLLDDAVMRDGLPDHALPC